MLPEAISWQTVDTRPESSIMESEYIGNSGAVGVWKSTSLVTSLIFGRFLVDDMCSSVQMCEMFGFEEDPMISKSRFRTFRSGSSSLNTFLEMFARASETRYSSMTLTNPSPSESLIWKFSLIEPLSFRVGTEVISPVPQETMCSS
ncbi:hypothetical protein WICPIJ_001600 [Wickerhamomyces pijperi]|uniref:Uncharacterized protein n=1 Tax=Wickerhamomyces pijperi TaxID=599730 RepID=A0A9P8TPR1_WICPI|nr:hypothetical protein WICPIJ_001600 [Wickerhamomyces pijperi]